MPCIFLHNITDLDLLRIVNKSREIQQLYVDVAAAVGVEPSQVELHLAPPGKYFVFKLDGSLDREQGIHAFVLWNAGRTIEQKAKLASLIDRFLSLSGLNTNLDITFFDMTPGTSFWFNGQMVSAPPDLPPPA